MFVEHRYGAAAPPTRQHDVERLTITIDGLSVEIYRPNPDQPGVLRVMLRAPFGHAVALIPVASNGFDVGATK